MQRDTRDHGKGDAVAYNASMAETKGIFRLDNEHARLLRLEK